MSKLFEHYASRSVLRRFSVVQHLTKGGLAFDLFTGFLQVASVIVDIAVIVHFASLPEESDGHLWAALVIAFLISTSIFLAISFVIFVAPKWPGFNQNDVKLVEIIFWSPFAHVLPCLTLYWDLRYGAATDQDFMKGDDTKFNYKWDAVFRTAGEYSEVEQQQLKFTTTATSSVPPPKPQWQLPRAVQQQLERIKYSMELGKFVQHFVKRRQVAHQLFFVSACVHSLPQFIIQLLAMSLHVGGPNPAPVQYVALVLAVATLFSKSYLVCRSMDIWAAVFKVLLVGFDIASVAFMASFIFHPDQPVETHALFGIGTTSLTAAWGIIFSIFCAIAVVYSIGMYIWIMLDGATCAGLVILPIMFVLLVLPGAAAFAASKGTFLALAMRIYMEPRDEGWFAVMTAVYHFVQAPEGHPDEKMHFCLNKLAAVACEDGYRSQEGATYLRDLVLHPLRKNLSKIVARTEASALSDDTPPLYSNNLIDGTETHAKVPRHLQDQPFKRTDLLFNRHKDSVAACPCGIAWYAGDSRRHGKPERFMAAVACVLAMVQVFTALFPFIAYWRYYEQLYEAKPASLGNIFFCATCAFTLPLVVLLVTFVPYLLYVMEIATFDTLQYTFGHQLDYKRPWITLEQMTDYFTPPHIAALRRAVPSHLVPTDLVDQTSLFLMQDGKQGGDAGIDLSQLTMAECESLKLDVEGESLLIAKNADESQHDSAQRRRLSDDFI